MKIHWLSPLYTNGASVEISVGINEGNEWFTRWGNKQPYLINKSKKEVMMLWPLLDEGYGGKYNLVFNLLESRLKEKGLPITLIQSFPFTYIALHAFNASTRQNKALEWLSNQEFTNELAAFSAGIIKDTKYSQEVRHLLKRSLKKWEKKNNVCMLQKS